MSKAHASDLIEAAYQCANNGANIISMSLGGGNPSGKEEQAFQSIYDAGILLVASAGNDTSDILNYPAAYETVISVAAIAEDTSVADFSNWNEDVELAAPGVAVLSTLPFISSGYVLVDGVEYAALGIEFAAQGTISGELVDGGFAWPPTRPAIDGQGGFMLPRQRLLP